MPMTQATLDFSAAPAAVDTLALIHWLALNPGWHTARKIAAELNLTDRQVRQLAEHSQGLIVSGPGTPGYQHISHCSAEQIAHACDTLASQGKAMLRRSIRLRRRAHALIR